MTHINHKCLNISMSNCTSAKNIEGCKYAWTLVCLQ